MEPASREERIKAMKTQLVSLHKEVKETQGEIEFLELYEDEADYAAHKIVEIMDQAGKRQSSKTAAIAEILRGRKTSLL